MRKTLVSGLIALGAGTAAVGAYLLVFLPWQRRWGATGEEVQRTLPGDEQISHPDTQWTRAITVKAKASDLWPWLLQIGQGRGGYYSYRWLEKLLGLKVEDADQINPAWQHLKAGDILPAEPDGSGYRVITVEPGRALVLGAQEKDEAVSRSFTRLYLAFTWAFVLEEGAHGQTRLITRMRAQTRRSLLAALAFLFIDFGAFLLKRRMLLGIKQRAERLSEQAERGAGALSFQPIVGNLRDGRVGGCV
ncbi:MAG TPA: hypothetical protein VNE38_11265 [Ktedonobacteraceae bacterium]|nr:hypothetical protein [Ktedonobacteraceae bacterium]